MIYLLLYLLIGFIYVTSLNYLDCRSGVDFTVLSLWISLLVMVIWPVTVFFQIYDWLKTKDINDIVLIKGKRK